ncbi:MAG: serine/threonine protein kinase [Bryobacteraceae bacterium]|nr:serine/threonine protein kinase [Bryobacteraceae bacterium]
MAVLFQPGQKVGDYEILDYLDRSKRGVLYKVRNHLAHRLESLRVLPDSVAADSTELERFVREIKVHARLSHPNIVTFYHATQIDGHPLMTAELVEGVTLEQRLELGAMSLENAAGFVRQLLAALEEAHGQGIMHREVTPAHIVVTPDGTLKLGGFGLAKSKTDPNLTQQGAVVGSVAYMSPEQVKGLDLDTRTDLYSVGCILYEMLTGARPFRTKSDFDLMLAHVQQIPEPPGTWKPGLPASLDAVVLRALAKDPNDRFQTAREFREALDGALISRDAPGLETQPAPAASPRKGGPVFIPMHVDAPARQTASVSVKLALAILLPLAAAVLFVLSLALTRR